MRCEGICISKGSFYRKPKNKVVHTKGMVGQVKWVPTKETSKSDEYTGVYKHGAENCIIQMTNTVNPNDGDKQCKPSFALKCFRNQNQSCDLMFLNGFSAIGKECNPFDIGYSNIVEMPKNCDASDNDTHHFSEGLKCDVLRKHDHWFNMTGTSECANNDASGKPLNIDTAPPKSQTWLDKHLKRDWTNVKAPFRIVVHPDENFKKACKGDIEGDMSSEDLTKCFENINSSLSDGSRMFEVWAQFDFGDEWKKIGDIVLVKASTEIPLFHNCPLVDKELKFTHTLSRREYGRSWMPRWKKQIRGFKAKRDQKILVCNEKLVDIGQQLVKVDLKEGVQMKVATIKQDEKEKNKYRTQMRMIRKEKSQVRKACSKEISGVRVGKINAYKAGRKGDVSKFVVESVDEIIQKITE